MNVCFPVAGFGNFELTEMPRFRSDPIGWGEFALSLCRQIVIDGRKARVSSWLRRTIIDLSEEAEEARNRGQTACDAA
jgi:hypothetical protein